MIWITNNDGENVVNVSNKPSCNGNFQLSIHVPLETKNRIDQLFCNGMLTGNKMTYSKMIADMVDHFYELQITGPIRALKKQAQKFVSRVMVNPNKMVMV